MEFLAEAAVERLASVGRKYCSWYSPYSKPSVAITWTRGALERILLGIRRSRRRMIECLESLELLLREFGVGVSGCNHEEFPDVLDRAMIVVLACQREPQN